MPNTLQLKDMFGKESSVSMCRYAFTCYKDKYACFDCRKCFRIEYEKDAGDKKCPDCGGKMHNMGLDFKAPPRQNRQQWEKVRLLYQNGIRYSSCGCSGPGYRPKHLREVPAFLAAEISQNEISQRLARQTPGEAKWAAQRRRAKTQNANE